MKTLKKISICLIISMAAFVCMEKDCFSFSGHSIYVIENTTNEEKSDNSITPDSDSSGIDVTLTQTIYSFNLKYLSSEKIKVSNTFLPQNKGFCIWQPPKIS